MSQKLDMILFGATGFTGKQAIPFMEKFSRINPEPLTWGIAGRSEEKLRSVLNDYQKQSEKFFDVPIIIADAENEHSLKNMVRKARIIINCCGPYHFYGEPVVKACIEEGTHYVDVSAEVQFLEKMQLKYNRKAEEKGVYVIGACGLESIPVDLAIVHLQKKFTGTLNSVVTYFEYWEEGYKASKGSLLSYGSWESLIYMLWNKKEIREIRQQLFSKQIPALKPELKLKVIPHKSDLVKGWAFPSLLADSSVVKRTQRYFYERHSKRPVQVKTYLTLQSVLHIILVHLGLLMLKVLTKFSFGKKILLKFPEKLTLGSVSRETPNKERSENGYYRITLCGEGWKEGHPDGNYQYTIPPNTAIAAEIKGRNPFDATNICAVLAAVTVIKEKDKMPSLGGVYPPGYAFANTSLLEKLQKNGIDFEVLYEKEL